MPQKVHPSYRGSLEYHPDFMVHVYKQVYVYEPTFCITFSLTTHVHMHLLDTHTHTHTPTHTPVEDWQPRTAIYTSGSFHCVTEDIRWIKFHYPTADIPDSLLSNRGPYPFTFKCVIAFNGVLLWMGIIMSANRRLSSVGVCHFH